MSDNEIEITLCHTSGTHGIPIIEINKGEIYTYIDKEGVFVAGYEEAVFTAMEDIDDLIACVNEAKRILADPPAHLLSERIPSPPPKGPPCHCLAEMRWDTADGGHWRHVDETITDHEAEPAGQPKYQATRKVFGSIDELNIT